MRITIITVCYNSVKTIEKAIKSIVSQNYYDLEYIIIDGGSKDGTSEIIENYREYISVYLSEPDGGIYDAMNKGLKYASGDIVAFLNSDDWYVSDIRVFDKVVEYFNSSKADIISGNIYRYKNGICKKTPKKKLTEENMFFGSICPHPAMFVKRELYYKLGGFDTSYQIAADTKWAMEAYLNGVNILFVDDYFTCFREGGISTTERYKTMEEEYEVMLECACKYHQEQMKDNIIAYYSSILKNLKNEKILKITLTNRQSEIRKLFDPNMGYYIWGAGARGKQCLEMFENLEIPVIGFIDIDLKKEKEGKYKVIRPIDIDKESYICITPEGYEEEIKIKLKSMGIEKSRFFTYSYLLRKIIEIGEEDEYNCFREIK